MWQLDVYNVDMNIEYSDIYKQLTIRGQTLTVHVDEVNKNKYDIRL